jgi:hypothetical protein
MIVDLIAIVAHLDREKYVKLSDWDNAVNQVLINTECPVDFGVYLNAAYENFKNVPSARNFRELQGCILIYQWINN